MDIGRNDPCACGSGKKYKKCCEAKNETKEREVLEKQWTQAVKKKEQELKEAEKHPDDKSAPAHHAPQNPSVKNTPAGPQKHQAFAGPKYNMPRKSGGG